MSTLLAIAPLFLTSVCVVIWLSHRAVDLGRRAVALTSENAALLAELATRSAQAATEQARAAQFEIELAEEKARIAQLEIELAGEKTRSAGYFRTIDGALLERNQWQAKYYQESIQHGNAQNLMLGAIERLRAALGSQAPKVDPIFLALRDEHRDQHVLPSVEAIAAIHQQIAVEAKPPDAVGPKTEVSR